MKKKQIRILGFSLIILTWIFWGMIILIPFLKLGLKTSAIAITILLIGTNVFYIGAFLVGKELMQKYNVWPKIKSRFHKSIKKKSG
jgi:predicted membrane channel-forming protein YqfA (hemolysin III family)